MKQLILGCFLTLLAGSIIYLFFRTDTLLIFKWLAIFSIDETLFGIRELTQNIKPHLPNWIIFSLPDGLWVFSYVSLTLLLWNNIITRANFMWVFLIPTIAISSELGQLFKIVQGTFDITDIFFYVVGTILPILIFLNKSG